MKILITRPHEEAISLAAKLKDLGYTTIVEPLIEVSFDPLDNFEDFSKYDAIVISSKNAIKAISSADKNLNLIIVGEESTKFARTLGFKNAVFGGKNIDELKQNLMNYKKLLYLTGSEITDDLSSSNNLIVRKVVYYTKPIQNVSANFLDFIMEPQPKIVLFFSTKTAQIFYEIISNYRLNSHCCNIIALTLSPKIAHNLTNMNFKNCFTAQEPNLKSVLNSIKKIQNG